MGACRRRRGLLPADPIQAWRRPLSAAARRWSGRARLARADGERGRQGAVQAAFDMRMHPCPLAQLEPDPLQRARPGQGRRRDALARAHKQHIASRTHVERPPHHHRIEAAADRAGHISRPATPTTSKLPHRAATGHISVYTCAGRPARRRAVRRVSRNSRQPKYFTSSQDDAEMSCRLRA